ncbi:sulfatase [Parapedobacter tibetensis]|uniref:sulfatase n=1 Tax=Parapedobacter tibetensis TaxID=2972951 RepID=UPI00214D8DB2|nr:sulfatase [Parapedobacter tibetensis]
MIRGNRKIFNAKALLVFIAATVSCTCFAANTTDRPNIVFILIDDLAWSDLPCYNNFVHETPHIDALAKESLRFTNAYAPAPICSASRASLLTGKSPARLHFEFVTKPDKSEIPKNTALLQPPYPRDLPLEEVTIPEVLGPGYIAGFYGKWHLTQESDLYLDWGGKFGPLQQGFATGSAHRGSHSYGYPKTGNQPFDETEEGKFPVDSLTEKAIDFLKSNRDTSFFLYYSMYYVHTPVQTRTKWLHDKYRKKLGDDATENHVHYGAFMETMDHHIGRLLQALEALALAENTLVILTSDNGGHPEYADNTPFNGSKWNLYEGGIRVPMLVKWPDRIAGGTVSDLPVTGMDLLPTLVDITSSKIPVNVELDGISLLPAFLGLDISEDAMAERELYWHFPFYHKPVVDTKPQSALRIGDYKLIYHYEHDDVELYRINADPGEQRDLSELYPERAKAMKEKLLSHLTTINARFPVQRTK